MPVSEKGNRKAVLDSVLKDFCTCRGIKRHGLSPGLKEAVFSVSVPFHLFIESLDDIGLSESEDPVDGLLATLTHRCFNTVSGSLALIATGQLQEAEVLARTVIESAVILLYVGQKNTGERLLQYFYAYLAEERKQNKRWENALTGCEEAKREEHKKRIKDKETALDAYQHFLTNFAQNVRRKLSPVEKWPSGKYQMFAALGKELDYRTVYAAMCSQSHHDAEDILNRIAIETMTGNTGLSERLRREKHAFSVFMVMFGVKYFLEAIKMLSERYKLRPLQIETDMLLGMVSKELENIGRALDAGKFPTHWRGRVIDGI